MLSKCQQNFVILQRDKKRPTHSHSLMEKKAYPQPLPKGKGEKEGSLPPTPP